MPALCVKAQYPLENTNRLVSYYYTYMPRDGTYVMGFMKGTLTSTASATKFSISRSMGRLYLFLTYSGLAAYRQATRPPRGVMPTRSPIPRTARQTKGV